VTPRYLLDTNLCIDLMKHQPPEVAARFAECGIGDVVISAVTMAELACEVARAEPARRPALRRALSRSHALALDATLVTNNEADFADYPGLRVDNWVSRA
jgi:tRNA(fMet)-specific endonuclease VapC